MSTPNLASVQLPDLMTIPTVAGTANGVGARPVASQSATRTQGGDFSHLMNLQGRGRQLEASLTKQAAGVTGGGDPAATAAAKQATFNAGELKAIRELVGPAPGGNARRALAAIVERLEGGGQLKPTDRARIRLAIAADERRVDLAGANAYRHAILELDRGYESSMRQSQDPTMVQDPARLASFQQRNHELHQVVGQLQQALGAPRLDPATAHALAGKVGGAGGSSG